MDIKQEVQTLKSIGVISPKIPLDNCIAFVMKCKELNLSPYTSEVFFSERFDPEQGKVFVSYLGIAGLRKKAREVSNYSVLPQTFNNGLNIAEVKERQPKECTFTIEVDGKTFSYSVNFEEYLPKNPKGLWITKPFVMISKVAEALCLRLRFSELNSLYIKEELDQLDFYIRNNVEKNKKAINNSINDILNG